jgi:probable F420-dependent oxidoreductase
MATRLQFSIAVGTPPGSRDARTLARHAARAEELGFVTLWLGDHLYLPGPTTHAPLALAVIAAATERVPIGFSAYVLPLRDPLHAAKELTALDVLSGGRLIAGLAAGSNQREFEIFGIPFAERGDRLDEGLEALMRLWTSEPVSFDGRFYQFPTVTLAPAPAQRPHPPVWIGSWTGNRRSADRVARYADGWQASGLHTPVGEIQRGWRQIEAACRAAGRDPSAIRRSYVNTIVRLDSSRERAMEAAPPAPFRTDVDLRIIGTPDDAIVRLQEIAAAGIEEVGVTAVGTSIEQMELFAREVMPAFA